ncbi:unnamed protein product [Adineta ricciae]|uniref:Uncharacterized protein n=1 Tax=Adineta ricciae TaxID=249248 RepID=A0A816HLS4_ADIRI|nr:unnamed protein product [Adineta ricciae]
MLPNKRIKLSENSQIRFLNFLTNGTELVTLRSILLPLAPYGSSSYEISTNLSTLLSCSLLDSNSHIITVNTSIEFHIERDLKRQIPSMVMQNVTSINSSLSLHFLNLTRRNNLSISFHFEMHPMDLFTNSIKYLD